VTTVRHIYSRAWWLMLLSAALQVVIFPLPNLYFLCWIAVAPLLAALLRARLPDTLQLEGKQRRVPATPLQGFLLGYGCGILWFAGTCYWVYDTMHRYGGLSVPPALLTLIAFCMYVGLYHGFFGLLVAIVAGGKDGVRRALMAAPFLWVGVELARTRITAFPWELLGYAQTSNATVSRFATIAGVYGLSWEIMLVNCAFGAAFLAAKERRKYLFVAAAAGALLLQAGQFLKPAPLPTTQAALLVQPNIPVQAGAEWTTDYFQGTLRDLSWISLNPPAKDQKDYGLIVWSESPSPFYTNDPIFRSAISDLALRSRKWVIVGAVGTLPPMHSGGSASAVFNSAALVTPQGEWTARYDKIHLVPFGEYLPFPQVFSFAGGLTKEVGQFERGTSRAPLDVDGARLGMFICYESIFPDEVRLFAANGADVFVNISNDGWYGDSGAWKQHLQMTQMRAIENRRWLLSDTNTGMTASIDPYGRIVAATPRKIRTSLIAPFATLSGTTFYTRHGDWFAYVCAIISAGAVLLRFLPSRQEN
jgi:apolipoprotein N-acyltransferase